MNRQNNQNWERKLQELEAEIYTQTPESVKPLWNDESDSQEIRQNTVGRVLSWFESLHPKAKVATIAIAAVGILFILQTIVKLVTALIGLAIFGTVLYLVYKFLIVPQSYK